MNIPVRHIWTGLVAAALPASASESIYWTATDASGGYVIRANGDGSNPTPVVSGNDVILGPNGLEYFHGVLYWPDQQLGAVKQVNPDGTGLRTFAEAQNPYDVFADGQAVYWTSQESNYIDTTLLDGSGYQRLLASPGVNRPFAIARTEAHLYWSQVTGSGNIVRSDPNGANPISLIPNAYVYDFQVTANYIYYADNNFPGGIRRANLDGSNGITLVPGGALFNGICVTDDAIYWSAFLDADGGGIRRSGLDGSNPVNLYNAPSGTSVRGVVVIPDNPGGGSPRFQSYHLGKEGLIVALEAEVGKPYRIETSSTLRPGEWTEVTNFTAASSLVNVTNAISPAVGNAYFRARTP